MKWSPFSGNQPLSASNAQFYDHSSAKHGLTRAGQRGLEESLVKQERSEKRVWILESLDLLLWIFICFSVLQMVSNWAPRFSQYGHHLNIQFTFGNFEKCFVSRVTKVTGQNMLWVITFILSQSSLFSASWHPRWEPHWWYNNCCFHPRNLSPFFEGEPKLLGSRNFPDIQGQESNCPNCLALCSCKEDQLHGKTIKIIVWQVISYCIVIKCNISTWKQLCKLGSTEWKRLNYYFQPR